MSDEEKLDEAKARVTEAVLEAQEEMKEYHRLVAAINEVFTKTALELSKENDK